MISLSAEATSALTRSFTYRVRVQSWLGETLLDDDIPVAAGREEIDRTLRIPERVTLTVPRLDRGTTYDPVNADDPLAAFGQHLTVSLGIGLGNGQTEWFQRGEYLISQASTSGDAVEVEAVGLLALVDEARLVSPYQPTGTLASTLRGLVEPALTVNIDAGLTDRAVPAGMNWDEDRLGAVLELLDAWPADASVTSDGYLSVIPATDPTSSVLALTDGQGGTVLHWAGVSTRDSAYTAVVARGTAADGGLLQGVAYDQTGGPLSSGGAFNPLPVPFFYASPLLTTVAQCNAAARTVLARLRRTSAPKVTAEMVPNPALLTGDGVSATGRGLDGQLCVLEAYSLSLTADGGSATATLRVI
jgi:hypothetical protein